MQLRDIGKNNTTLYMALHIKVHSEDCGL